MPPYVERILANLKEASNPDSDHNPPLSRFLSYLNHEQEGLAWFLYECISTRWMYGSVRLDYIRSLVDEIENLDGKFPLFPGSPQGKTIRQFVQENLETDELAYVQMMPPLVYETPVRSARANYSYAQRAPRRATASVAPQVVRTLSQQFESLTPQKSCILIHFIRKKDESQDDVLKISKNSEDSYTISYTDKQSNMKSKKSSLTRVEVINFLRLTLRMLTVDEEPFQSVQFTLPSMPAIMVSPKNLSSQTRDLIYDSVEATMDSWPVTL
jgi:hypothetical protein